MKINTTTATATATATATTMYFYCYIQLLILVTFKGKTFTFLHTAKVLPLKKILQKFYLLKITLVLAKLQKFSLYKQCFYNTTNNFPTYIYGTAQFKLDNRMRVLSLSLDKFVRDLTISLQVIVILMSKMHIKCTRLTHEQACHVKHEHACSCMIRSPCHSLRVYALVPPLFSDNNSPFSFYTSISRIEEPHCLVTTNYAGAVQFQYNWVLY